MTDDSKKKPFDPPPEGTPALLQKPVELDRRAERVAAPSPEAFAAERARAGQSASADEGAPPPLGGRAAPQAPASVPLGRLSAPAPTAPAEGDLLRSTLTIGGAAAPTLDSLLQATEGEDSPLSKPFSGAGLRPPAAQAPPRAPPAPGASSGPRTLAAPAAAPNSPRAPLTGGSTSEASTSAAPYTGTSPSGLRSPGQPPTGAVIGRAPGSSDSGLRSPGQPPTGAVIGRAPGSSDSGLRSAGQPPTGAVIGRAPGSSDSGLRSPGQPPTGAPIGRASGSSDSGLRSAGPAPSGAAASPGGASTSESPTSAAPYTGTSPSGLRSATHAPSGAATPHTGSSPSGLHSPGPPPSGAAIGRAPGSSDSGLRAGPGVPGAPPPTGASKPAAIPRPTVPIPGNAAGAPSAARPPPPAEPAKFPTPAPLATASPGGTIQAWPSASAPPEPAITAPGRPSTLAAQPPHPEAIRAKPGAALRSPDQVATLAMPGGFKPKPSEPEAEQDAIATVAFKNPLADLGPPTAPAPSPREALQPPPPTLARPREGTAITPEELPRMSFAAAEIDDEHEAPTRLTKLVLPVQAYRPDERPTPKPFLDPRLLAQATPPKASPPLGYDEGLPLGADENEVTGPVEVQPSRAPTPASLPLGLGHDKTAQSPAPPQRPPVLLGQNDTAPAPRPRLDAARPSAPALERTEPISELPARPASAFRRLFAWLVDGLLVAGASLALLFVATLVIGGSEQSRVEAMIKVALPGAALAVFLAFTYTLTCAFVTRGRTVGLKLAGLHVVDRAGHPPGLFRLFARAVLSGLSAAVFFAGFWWGLFDRKSQTIHDKLTGTFIVQLQA